MMLCVAEGRCTVSDKNPLLKIKFSGSAIGPGRIPVDHLLVFLSHMTKAFKRTGRVLFDDAESRRSRTAPHSIKHELSLELVLLTHGSPDAVLGFNRKQTEPCLPGIDYGMDYGMDVLEKTLSGLNVVQGDDEVLPPGFDTGVLSAWRDAGKVLNRGISKIVFELNHGAIPFRSSLTSEGFRRIQQRITGHQTNIRTIEGRLLMADFKEQGARCRVHPSAGEPVLCQFDEEQRDCVYENILQFVSIIGEAKEDAETGKIHTIKIFDVNRIEDRDGEAVELLPLGTPIGTDFWKSPTLEELAASQEVEPMDSIEAIFGTWPDDANDGFEESVHALRHKYGFGENLR
jgi:hypothetical protein